MAADPRQTLGKLGEDLACAELRRRGYAVLARRYRSRLGEIDIVAEQDGVLVFVEVKTRIGPEFGGGAEAVTATKQRRIALVAAEFLARSGGPCRPCRFDVVMVDLAAGRDGGHRVQVVVSAFDRPG